MQNKHRIQIIGLTALPGAGKDYVADLLVSEYGFYKIAPGDIVREILSQHGANITREEQHKIQQELREKYGKDYIMELCQKKIEESGKDKIVIPGIRTPADLLFFRQRYDGMFRNGFIYASKKVRYQRSVDRKRMDVPSSYEEFLKQDAAEKKLFDLTKTIELCDFVLNNNKNDSPALKKGLEKIIASLK